MRRASAGTRVRRRREKERSCLKEEDACTYIERETSHTQLVHEEEHIMEKRKAYEIDR